MAKRKHAKHNRDPGQFAAIPFSVLDSRAFLNCGAHSRMLLLDLCRQFRGNNNGDLCVPWKHMKDRGWKSQETLSKAKRELLRWGLIVETRKGGFPNKASLYALTWLGLDHCNGKLDISNKGFPRSKYLMWNEPHVHKHKKSLNTVTVSETNPITTVTVAKGY